MPLRTSPWERRKRAGPVISGGQPRPPTSPNPAAAVLGGVSLTGEERLLSFGDPHAVPVSEMMRDPVFNFEGTQLPTNYQSQQIGTGMVVSRRGGSIRTPEWEQGEKLRRAWERSEYALGQAIRAGDTGNVRLQEAVGRARQALFDSPLFDVEGDFENVGNAFKAVQRQADGMSILERPQEPLTPGGLEAPPLTPAQITFRGKGRQEIGETMFERTTIAAPGERGREEWEARSTAFVEARARALQEGRPPPGRVPTPITQIDGVWTGRGAPRPEGAPARITEAQRAEATREQATQIGVPAGTKRIVGPHKELTNLLRQAKTAKEKDAALAKMERRLGGKWDLSTHKGYMAAKQAQFKRGAKKRLGRKEQQDITDALTDLPPDRVAEMVDRLNADYDRNTLMKVRAYRQALTQYGLKAPKQKTGRLTAAKKPASAKSELTAMRALWKIVDEAMKAKEPTEDKLSVLSRVHDAQQEMHIVAGFSREDFSKRWEGALASEPGLSEQFRNFKEARERFISEGGALDPGAGATQQAVAQPPIVHTGFAGSAYVRQPPPVAQPPQGARMGTSPVVGVVTSTPPGMPDFPEDMSFFKPKHDGSGMLYDEQAGVTMTITKDGRRYWTHVVMRGGKQVSQTYELEGGGPPPNFGQEAGAEAPAAGKPAAKAAPAAAPSVQDKQKAIEALTKAALYPERK